MKYKLRSKVWLYPGAGGWHFASINKKVSKEIRKDFGQPFGFGSIPVIVKTGKTTWETSIFFDSKSGTYLLPLKAEVRKKENIEAEKFFQYEIKIDI